jgi:hypothetical protein
MDNFKNNKICIFDESVLYANGLKNYVNKWFKGNCKVEIETCSNQDEMIEKLVFIDDVTLYVDSKILMNDEIYQVLKNVKELKKWNKIYLLVNDLDSLSNKLFLWCHELEICTVISKSIDYNDFKQKMILSSRKNYSNELILLSRHFLAESANFK